MKKIIISLLTLFCAAACMLTLASCGNGNAEDIISSILADATTAPTTTDAADGGNNNPNPENTLTANTDFQALVSEEVTAEAWAAAFSDASLANSTIKHTNTYYNREAYRYAELNGIYLLSMQQVEQNERETHEEWVAFADGIAYLYMMDRDGTIYRMPGDPTSPEVQWYFPLPLFCRLSQTFMINLPMTPRAGHISTMGTDWKPTLRLNIGR